MPVDKDAVYVANESFAAQDGSVFTKGVTRASGELVKKNKWEHLFDPIDVHYKVESATKAPGQKRGEE